MAIDPFKANAVLPTTPAIAAFAITPNDSAVSYGTAVTSAEKNAKLAAALSA
jgi:hypothetical protein